MLESRAGLSCVGVEGSGGALVAHRLLRSGAPRVICLCADAEAAQRTASDLTAFTRGLGFSRLPALAGAAEPLLITAQEATPYAEARADRRLSMLRAAALTGEDYKGDTDAAIASCLGTITELNEKLGIPSLHALGVGAADLSRIVAGSRGSSMRTNPVTLSDQQLNEILQIAL